MQALATLLGNLLRSVGLFLTTTVRKLIVEVVIPKMIEFGWEFVKLLLENLGARRDRLA